MNAIAYHLFYILHSYLTLFALLQVSIDILILQLTGAKNFKKLAQVHLAAKNSGKVSQHPHLPTPSLIMIVVVLRKAGVLEAN